MSSVKSGRFHEPESKAMQQVLQRVEWQGVTRELGTAWRLTKGTRSACCVLVNHPLGWELRLEIDGELIRSQTFREADRALRRLPAEPCYDSRHYGVQPPAGRHCAV